MSVELELANAKIKELTDRLKAYAKLEEHLIPLPNGDLHRGVKSTSAALANIDTEVIPESFGNPLDKAVAKCLLAAKSGHPLVCLWCGLDYGIPGPQNVGGEKSLREHIVKDHPSIVEGHDKIVPELLMANLEEAKQRLAEATSEK